jgi:hypothetical protein
LQKKVIAPYEADAQLAYLARAGEVAAVITEDSDLLAYGCPVVLFKMDRAGDAQEVALADLPACRDLALAHFPHALFQQVCALAGCDFVKALPGVGIKTAHAHVRRTRDFRRALRALRFDGVRVPDGYAAAVQRALWTWRHQRVYCARRRAAVPLTEPPGGSLAAEADVPEAAELRNGEPDFLGPEIPPRVAAAIAEGELDPVTRRPYGAVPYSDEEEGGGEAGGAGGARSAAGQLPLAAFPGFAHGASAAARAGFKRPRITGAGGSGGEDSSQEQQAPAAARPAPGLTSRHFSGGDGGAPRGLPTGLPLRAALWQALRADEAAAAPQQQQPQREPALEPEQELAQEQELEPAAAAAASPLSSPLPSLNLSLSLGLGGSDEQALLGLGPWRPQLAAPAAAAPAPPHSAAGATPWTDQRRFYSVGTDPSPAPLLALASGAAAARGAGAGASTAARRRRAPLEEALPPTEVQEDAGADAGAAEDLIADLSHLPEFVRHARAAVDAAMAQALGGPRRKGGRGRAAGAAAAAEEEAPRPPPAVADFSRFAFTRR